MSNEVMDREATEFAMELLMPSAWVLDDLKRGMDIGDDKQIEKLAKKYRVSTTMMCLRIGQLMGRIAEQRKGEA
jgi:Zn-dependent peptidase ImmA (M78 family)